MEAQELQLDVEQINSQEDRHSFGSSMLDKARAPPSSSSKARSSRNSKVRRSPYQVHPSAAATGGCGSSAEAGASKISEEYAISVCEYSEVAATPCYDYSDDAAKVDLSH